MTWLKSIFGGKAKAAEPAPQASAAPDKPTAPFEITRVPGDAALAAVLDLRAGAPSSSPVALGDNEDLERVLEAFEYDDRSVEDILRLADSVDISAWIDERIAADPDYYEDGDAQLGDPQQAAPLSLAYDVLSGKPKAAVHIAHIPTAKSWEVPAHLKIGGWNECPSAEVHVAFFKSWQARYGAEVVGIGPDTIEFMVGNPPADMDEARRLAREQFIYCADIVHQGVQSVENLAKVLHNGSNWYFWWD